MDVRPKDCSGFYYGIFRLDLSKVLVQYLHHGAACDIHPFFSQSAFMEIFSCVFTVCKVYVADDVHDPTVGLLGQTFVLAAGSHLHVKDRGKIEICRQFVGFSKKQEFVLPRISSFNLPLF